MSKNSNFLTIFAVGLIGALFAASIFAQTTPTTISFSKTLQRGSSGEEVRRLQEFLKTMSDVYPEGLVTGYFGTLTEKAVKKFQGKYNISSIGVVGPLTRAQLNKLIGQKPQAMPPLEAKTPPVPSSEKQLLLPSCPTDTATHCRITETTLRTSRATSSTPTSSTSLPQSTPTSGQSTATLPSEPNCVSNPSPVFTNHVTDMSKVSYVVPPPTMGSGPSLKTHSYIGTNGVNVPIYAPTAMTLKYGSHYVGGPYGFGFQASCEVTVRFGHITNPVDSIKKLLPSEPQSDSRTQELSPVSFAAGDLVGYTTGTNAAGNWDFGVYNSATSNRYAQDQNWNNSTVYTTAVCPFAYFAPNLKTEYAAKLNSTILGGNLPHGESFCL